jgi:aquaglyceroporin related protein
MEKAKAKLTVKNELLRAAIGEFLGTLVLVLVINSVVAQSILTKIGPPTNALINVNIGVGLGIAFGIALCAKVSGGHINPAVSLMFLTFRQITALRFIVYVIAQTLGAFVGAALTYAVYHRAINQFDSGVRQVYGLKKTAHIFASYPHEQLGHFNGLLDQIVATALFCMFIAHVTDPRNRYPSWVQPYIIGTVFIMVGTAFALNAGYPCNPARDFGPRLFSLIIGYGSDVFGAGDYWFWVPIVGPMIGALIGGWLYQIAVGFQLPLENEYEVVATGPRELQPVVTVHTTTVTEEHH